MGVEAGLGLTALSAAFGVSQGVDQSRAARTEASQILAETEEETARRKKEIKKFASDQEVSFLKSGVSLQGSPLLVLEETRREGLKEIEGIRRSGGRRASSVLSAGRNALLGSIFGGLGELGQAFAGAGGFDKGMSSPNFDVRPTGPGRMGAPTRSPSHYGSIA